MIGFELTPWERRREWYSNIQLGRDVRTQSALISHQTKAMITAQAATTNALILSQDRIRDGLDNLTYSMDEVEEGINGLKAAFEFGISEVVWQIEQNRQVLKNILEVLVAPLDTQAKELRRNAENAYANGWIDDALEDFLESETKIKYDFAVHISIGMIFLFQKADRKKALEYFEKAAKYARPNSPYHASFALMHAALIKLDWNLFEEAEKLTAEGIALTPNFAELLYQNAQYNAQLNNVEKSIYNLGKAIKIDKNYCIKADNDKMFDPIRNAVDSFFMNLRDTAIHYCNDRLSKLSSIIDNTKNIITSANLNDFEVINYTHNFKIIDFSPDIAQITEIIKRNSYFDALDATNNINTTFSKVREYIKKADSLLVGIISRIDYKINSILSNIKHEHIIKTTSYTKKVGIIGTIISIIFGIKSCQTHTENVVKRPSQGIGDLLGDLLSGTVGSVFILVFIAVVGSFISWQIGKAIATSKFGEPITPNEVNKLSDEKSKVSNLLTKVRGII